jgi:hypothetical protein
VADQNTLNGKALRGEAFTGKPEKLVDALLESFATRFEDISTGILKATQLTNLRLWPSLHGDITCPGTLIIYVNYIK